MPRVSAEKVFVGFVEAHSCISGQAGGGAARFRGFEPAAETAGASWRSAARLASARLAGKKIWFHIYQLSRSSA